MSLTSGYREISCLSVGLSLPLSLAGPKSKTANRHLSCLRNPKGRRGPYRLGVVLWSHTHRHTGSRNIALPVPACGEQVGSAVWSCGGWSRGAELGSLRWRPALAPGEKSRAEQSRGRETGLGLGLGLHSRRLAVPESALTVVPRIVPTVVPRIVPRIVPRGLGALLSRFGPRV